MIINIEGTDGSGKATQSKILYDYLCAKGYKCKLISFPNYESKSSGAVKMYLNGELGNNYDLNGYQVSSLYAVDRFVTMKNIDVAKLDYLILDRYTPSNMIHQSTRIIDRVELDDFLEWVADYEYDRLGLPRPDLTIFLDVPVDISIQFARNRNSLKNGEKKDILEGDEAHLISAYHNAKYIANKFNWIRIECAKNGEIMTVENIASMIRKAIGLEE